MSENTRRFVYDGKECYFSKETFKLYFQAYRTANKLHAHDVETLIAQKACVSEAAVHGWLYGKTGPANTGIITAVADFFSRHESEFYVEEEQIKMEKLSEPQIAAVDRIYKEIINFLFVFLQTDGLFISDSSIHGINTPLASRLAFADSEYEKVRVAWYKEFVYLNGTKVYDELDDYIDNDLLGTYQDISGNIPDIDKCSECYRYEPEEGKSASDDFEEAMIKIQQLVSRYV